MFLPNIINRIGFDIHKLTDIQFVNVAYRPEPPKEATGGPNGVLKIQKEFIGEKYRGFYQRYIFEPKEVKLPDEYINFFKQYKIGTMTKKLIEADYYFQHQLYNKLPIKKFMNLEKKYIFICHDIGSAVGAYHLGCSYILIYHQQGAFVHERTSFGEKLSDIEKNIMNTYEKEAFNHAEKVYFPSLGAKECFCTTTEMDISTVKFSNEPLYNTVNDFVVDIDAAKKFFIDHGYSDLLNEKTREKYIIFISIGDYTFNKGIDRCPELLNAIAENTNKTILWIVIGSKHKSDIFEELCTSYNNGFFKFKAIFIPVRLEHSLAMGILHYADYLLMLQRFSIFDFSSLEAMKLNKQLILSNCYGNVEFNKENNVILINPEQIDNLNINNILHKNYINNKIIFEKYFSKDAFIERYAKIYDNLISKYVDIQDICQHQEFIDDSELDGMIRNKDIIIFGPGSSASNIQQQLFTNHILVALNSALTLNYPFNIHIMQDQPKPESLYDIYLKKNVKRVYGIINRSATKHLAINFSFFDKKNIKYTRYNLSNSAFDARYDTFDLHCKKHPVYDMYGILFSALQIIGSCKPKSIQLVGIDFSDQNVNHKNLNKYNNSVFENLDICLHTLYNEGINISIIYTTSQIVAKIVNKYSSTNVMDKVLLPNTPPQKAVQQKYSRLRKIRKFFVHPIKFFNDIKK